MSDVAEEIAPQLPRILSAWRRSVAEVDRIAKLVKGFEETGKREDVWGFADIVSEEEEAMGGGGGGGAPPGGGLLLARRGAEQVMADVKGLLAEARDVIEAAPKDYVAAAAELAEDKP